MKRFLKAAGLLFLAFCALNFFILGGLLLYVLVRFDVNREKVVNARLAIEGRKYMTEDEEKFLGKFKEEEIIDVLRTHQQAQYALKRGGEELDRRKVNLRAAKVFLDEVAKQVELERYEANKVLTEIRSEREAISKAKRQTLEEVTSASFKKRYEMLMRMEPTDAAQVLKTKKPEDAAKYFALMPTRKSAAIMGALLALPGGVPLCADIVDKIKVLEDLQGTSTE